MTTHDLTYDDSLMRSENVGVRGVRNDKIFQINKEYLPQYKSISEKLQNKQFDFANLCYDRKILSQCKTVWQPYASFTKKVVFVGIGGGSQTAKMLYYAFGRTPKNLQVYFVGDYTDPDEFLRLRSEIEGHEAETSVVVLSKSGTTVEVGAGYLYFRDFMQDKLKESWKKHFLFVTGAHEGILIKEAKENGLTHIPTSVVGDRFAPFSSLGLLPAVVMGIDAEKLLTGGALMFGHIVKSSQEKNIAWSMAVYQHIYQKMYGINQFVTMSYISRLEEFNMWLREMWGESLGKEKKGLILFPAMGPKDQHSVLQTFNDGHWFSTFLFISQSSFDEEISIENRGITDLNHLDGKKLSYITNASCRNTQLTLKNYNRPSAQLIVSEFNEKTMGELIALFEMVVLYLGEFVGLKNVFDQPAVTESRLFIDASMKRPGSEEFQQNLTKMEENIKHTVITFPT
ncbi:hypothetical protein HZC27_00640 [Candidatus Roizmanbacteria bacterium]|nr:hypothetical protein [Candidatus Roizmanbacteria bacterium]